MHTEFYTNTIAPGTARLYGFLTVAALASVFAAFAYLVP